MVQWAILRQMLFKNPTPPAFRAERLEVGAQPSLGGLCPGADDACIGAWPAGACRVRPHSAASPWAGLLVQVVASRARGVHPSALLLVWLAAVVDGLTHAASPIECVAFTMSS